MKRRTSDEEIWFFYCLQSLHCHAIGCETMFCLDVFARAHTFSHINTYTNGDPTVATKSFTSSAEVMGNSLSDCGG